MKPIHCTEQALFIADIHLAPEYPDTAELFFRFMAERATQAQHLFILGDLFDAWIGDDDLTDFHLQVFASMHRLSEQGVGCWLMYGNRDFLMGRRFCRATGFTILPDPTRIYCGSEPVLLMHGDLLCTDDAAYQRFRRRVHNPIVKWLFMRKSLAKRRQIAADYRRRSTEANASKRLDIMDVTPATVIDYMKQYQVPTLVHGHTHRPADHQVDLPTGRGWRLVLADWHAGKGEALVWQSSDDDAWQREPLS